MAERILCLDTSVLVQYLMPEDQHEAAVQLLDEGFRDLTSIVVPAWAWAETGSAVMRKVRRGLLQEQEADLAWRRFNELPIDFVENRHLRVRSWEIAETYGLPNLYDAAFLACTEMTPAEPSATREFWTADSALVRQLGVKKPPYVHDLGELSG